jgi:hypothetical protein
MNQNPDVDMTARAEETDGPGVAGFAEALLNYIWIPALFQRCRPHGYAHTRARWLRMIVSKKAGIWKTRSLVKSEGMPDRQHLTIMPSAGALSFG